MLKVHKILHALCSLHGLGVLYYIYTTEVGQTVPNQTELALLY